MKLDAHGSILQFSTNGHGRMVHDGQSSTSWRAEWATGRIPLVQYLVPAKDGGFHTLSAAWDVNRKEWFDIFGKESRQPGDWGALDRTRHELEHAVRVVPHVFVP